MPNERVFWKGLVAGLVGGLVATAAKTLAEKMYPPQKHGETEPEEVIAEKIAGHPLDPQTEEIAAEAIHWGIGMAAGAFYGVLAEYYPAATAKQGASFGLTMMTLTEQKAFPLLGAAPAPEDQSMREKASEGATHLLYGVVTEKVRGWVREALD